MRKLAAIFIFLFTMFFLPAQQVGVDFFYCENTLAPTFLEDVSGEPVKIEIALNEKASINKLALFGTLFPGNSFVGNATFPIDFSTNTQQTLQITNGTDLRDMQISAKRINKRNAPFTITFTDRFNSSDWIRSTTGWMSIGVKDSGKGVELNKDKAAFFLAFNPNQGLLSFDVSGENLTEFQGIFSVEYSKTGVDDWEPLFVIDNCENTFKSNQYTVFLKIENNAQYIRFSSQTGEIVQPIYLNNFSVGAYNGETVDNLTAVESVSADTIRLKSNFVKEEIEILGLENGIGAGYGIYSLEGKLTQFGKLENPAVKIGQLRPGIYFFLLKTNKNKALKFIKY